MSIEDSIHAEFKYVFIPADINDPVDERVFEGKEVAFKDLMMRHFCSSQLDAKGQEKLKESISEEVRKNAKDVQIQDAHMRAVMDQSNNYQIIPLTLPCKATDFRGINMYIDNVGRIKGLPVNARASRVSSDDIRGDAFLCITFDDEETFRREDTTRAKFEELLQSPPSKRGRWDPSKLMSTVQQAASAETLAKELKNADEKKCSNCYKRVTSNMRCGRCARAWYCNAECQHSDWAFHKRVCRNA